MRKWPSLIDETATVGLRSRSEPSFYEISHVLDVLLPVLERQVHVLAQLIHHFLDGVVVDHQ